MNEVVNINGTDIQVKIWNGQKVVTFADIDKVHKRADGTARKRFNDNNVYPNWTNLGNMERLNDDSIWKVRLIL